VCLCLCVCLYACCVNVNVYKKVFITIDTYVIIIISPLQSTAGHRPLQSHAISLDHRLLASSSCQPSCATRHSTWPEGVLHYVYLDAVFTPELVCTAVVGTYIRRNYISSECLFYNILATRPGFAMKCSY
jgi:hypothetical protein